MTTLTKTEKTAKKKTPNQQWLNSLTSQIAESLEHPGIILLCFKDNPSGPSIVHSSTENLADSLTYLTVFLLARRGCKDWTMPGTLNGSAAGSLPSAGVVSPAEKRQTDALIAANQHLADSITSNWNHLLISFERGPGGVMHHIGTADRHSAMRTSVEWLQRNNRFETWMHSVC